MALVAVMFGAVVGTISFLISLIALGQSFTSAAAIYFASAFAAIALVSIWRLMAVCLARFSNATVNIQAHGRARR